MLWACEDLDHLYKLGTRSPAYPYIEVSHSKIRAVGLQSHHSWQGESLAASVCDGIAEPQAIQGILMVELLPAGQLYESIVYCFNFVEESLETLVPCPQQP